MRIPNRAGAAFVVPGKDTDADDKQRYSTRWWSIDSLPLKHDRLIAEYFHSLELLFRLREICLGKALSELCFDHFARISFLFFFLFFLGRNAKLRRKNRRARQTTNPISSIVYSIKFLMQVLQTYRVYMCVCVCHVRYIVEGVTC